MMRSRSPLPAFVLTLASMIAASVAAQAQDPRQSFGATVDASRQVLSIDGNGRAAGPAADFLLARAHESRFVLVGEEHGVATIADTVQAIARSLQQADYRHFAIEADALREAVSGLGRRLRLALDKAEARSDRKAELFARDAMLRIVSNILRMVW